MFSASTIYRDGECIAWSPAPKIEPPADGFEPGFVLADISRFDEHYVDRLGSEQERSCWWDDGMAG